MVWGLVLLILPTPLNAISAWHAPLLLLGWRSLASKTITSVKKSQWRFYKNLALFKLILPQIFTPEINTPNLIIKI
jgi:hypothetical protein